MAHGFDEALVARARNRELLAEVMEEKYAAETKARNFKRLLMLGFAAGVALYVTKGALFIAKTKKNQKPVSIAEAQAILDQLKKQMGNSDQMMIGGDAAEPPRTARSKGEKESFSEEKIPAHLLSELMKKPKPPAKSPKDFSPPAPKQAKDLEEIGQRKIKHPKVECGMYRPLALSDMPKLPPVIAKKSPPAKALYLQTDQIPSRLAGEIRAFPEQKK
jgi:hypothetical protein